MIEKLRAPQVIPSGVYENTANSLGFRDYKAAATTTIPTRKRTLGERLRALLEKRK